MRKIKLYIAVSLDGKIAKPDGSVNWLHELPVPEGEDYGYSSLMESVDTTLMGHSTYKQIIGFDIPFPYQDKTNYVFSRSPQPEAEFVEFVSENVEGFVQKLKEQEGKDIWLIGGGQLNTTLFNADLVDEILIYVMPIVLGEGISLFGDFPKEKVLKLEETKSYSSSVVMMRYTME